MDLKPKELSDMPVDVIDNILDHLSLLERLVVRNVSRDLRHLIDKCTTSVKKIYFTISADSYFVSIDNNCTSYKESKKLKTTQWHYESYYGNPLTVRKVHRTTIEGPDAMKNSLIHLAYYLRNPELKFKYLSIGVADDAYEYGHGIWDNITKCYDQLEPLLLSLEHQISTEAFSYSYVSEYFFLVALKCFKPGVLEVIHGEAYWYRYEDYDLMGEIVETEQWKHTKRFISYGTMPAIVDGIAHFEEFNMNWNQTEPENVVHLKEVLSASKTFKKGGLSIFNRDEWPRQNDVEHILEVLGPRIFKDPENLLKWSYPIPGTNEFLNFQKDRTFGFSIKRTT